MNKAKGRQHTRKAARRAALRLKRAQKANAKKIIRAKHIARVKIDGNISYRHSANYETPSDLRRRSRRTKQS